MNCPKCNSNTDSAGTFCVACGVRISATTEMTPGQINYESLEALFRANDWKVLKDDGDDRFRVSLKNSYKYVVRLQQGKRITFSMYWRMSETASMSDLYQLANVINVKTHSTINAILEYDSGGVEFVTTIAVLMDSSITFADLERHVIESERDWDFATNNSEFSEYLYSSKSEG